jgi:hypothetical protein
MAVNRLNVGATNQLLAKASTGQSTNILELQNTAGVTVAGVDASGNPVGGLAAPNAAGKNKIINGDFGIWQRGTSFTNTANAGYTADRWLTNVGTGGTIVTSQQSFTPGTAPVAGYEAPFFLRLNRSTTGSGTSYFVHRIEDVRTFAGQTVTLSFWAKASSAYTFDSGDIYGYRNYGTGGSTAEGVGTFGAATLSTSWQRFSLTLNIPSVSGKTIGASSYLEIAFSFPTSKSTFTIDIWGVQVEAGAIATPFVPAGGGGIGAELALCQRYYYRNTATSSYSFFGLGTCSSTTAMQPLINLPVTLRANPSSVDYSTLIVYDHSGAGVNAVTNLVLEGTSTLNTVGLSVTVASGLTTARTSRLAANNSTSAYIGFNSEL